MRPEGSRAVGGRARLLYHAVSQPKQEEAQLKVNLVAMAEKPDAEEIVAATVEVDGRR